MKFLVKVDKTNVEIRELLLSVYGNATISRAMFSSGLVGSKKESNVCLMMNEKTGQLLHTQK